LLSGLAPKLHELVDGQPSRVTPVTMAAAATAGEETVRDAIERAATWLGIAAVNVVVTLHPDLIVLGGGVAMMGELLREPVERTMRQRIRMIPPESIDVRLSLLADRAGVLGGIALAARAGC
jgi:glucokinase